MRDLRAASPDVRPVLNTPLFTPDQRHLLRSKLLRYAADDPRISGAAITGSAAAGREDRWSDIDLAFGVADAPDLPKVLADWTAHMYDRHLAEIVRPRGCGASAFRSADVRSATRECRGVTRCKLLMPWGRRRYRWDRRR